MVGMASETSPSSEFMDVEELAALLRTTPSGIYNLRFRKEGPPAVRVGKRALLFHRSEVERWWRERLEQRDSESNGEAVEA